jgi:hypothetical protein
MDEQMSKPKQKISRSHKPPAKPGRRRTVIIALAMLVALAVVLIIREKQFDFQTLNGRWLRPDGGYILEIRAVDPSGKIDAAYFNPQPINIAKAEATRDGAVLKVLVELRAPNYPGSTYTLTYDPQQDQLRGTYFQAALQQWFEVNFVRTK